MVFFLQKWWHWWWNTNWNQLITCSRSTSMHAVIKRHSVMISRIPEAFIWHSQQAEKGPDDKQPFLVRYLSIVSHVYDSPALSIRTIANQHWSCIPSKQMPTILCHTLVAYLSHWPETEKGRIASAQHLSHTSSLLSLSSFFLYISAAAHFHTHG